MTRQTYAKHRPKESAVEESCHDKIKLQLPNSRNEEIVAQSVRDAAEGKCFPSNFREQFIGFTFVMPSVVIL